MYKKFDSTTLEREYSPSSCVSDINIYIQQYIQYSQLVTDEAIATKSVLLDLSYGESEEQLLDLYLPLMAKGSEPNKNSVQPINNRKLQVYIHGGYWQELTKKESSFAAKNFQQHGCYFAVINYSLAPKASLTEIVEENRQAIAWLVSVAQTYGFDANEIYLSGSSAGAHLAMMMLQTNWPDYIKSTTLTNLNHTVIKGVCAVSGIYDITPIVDTSINQALQLSTDEIHQYSPIFHEVTNFCPIILAFGDNETQEFKRQTLAITTKLKQSKFNIQQKEILGRNHFDVILDLCSPKTWLCQQIFKQMNIDYE